MADATLSFNILTKYQDRGVKQATKDFDGLRTKTVAVGTFIGQAMFGATKAVIGFAKQGLGSAIAEAREAGKVTRITENVIRSTGGAAKISAAQVGKLAESLSNKTAIDDELVQSGANLLLTFKNIRNEAGKGNDIFNQATAAALDLSAAGFGSVESASKMLGKALNDPLKGITALSRAGVTFTDGQKKQIKALVESGNVLGAQKIIMQEVASQVGGAAKAAADPMQRLGVIAANLKERIGIALLPIIGKVADWLGKKLPAALDKASLGTRALVAAFKDGDVTSDGFVGVMERIGVAARQVAGFFTTQIVPAITGFLKGMRDGTGAGGVFASVLAGMAKAGAATIAFFAKHTTLLKTLAATIGVVVVVTKLHTLAMAAQAAGGMIAFLATYLKGIKLVQVATKVWTAVTWALNLVMAGNPIALVVVAVVGLVAAIVIAYKQSDRFRAIVQAAWRGIQTAASFAWSRVLKPTFAGIVMGLRVGWAAFQVYARIVGAVWSGVGRAAMFAWRNVVAPVFRFIGAGLRAGWAVFQVYARVVGGVWGSVGRGISRVWTGVIAPVFSAVRGGVIRVRDTFSSVVTAIGRAWGRLTGIIAGPARAAAGWINRYVIGNVNRFTKPFGLTIPSIPRFAAGGRVPGHGTGDKVPALLEPGEFVVRKRVVRTTGVRRFLETLNEGDGRTMADAKEIADRRRRMQGGGIVFPLPSGSYTWGQGSAGHGYPAQDFPARRGTTVRAAMDGRIVRAAMWNTSYGHHVIMQHANSLSTLYAHLDRILSQAGNIIAGTPIGTVDSTGNSTGDHLHFEALRYGSRIDPVAFLRGAASGGPGNILTGGLRALASAVAKGVLGPLKGLARKAIGSDGFRGVLSTIVGRGIDSVLNWIRGKESAGLGVGAEPQGGNVGIVRQMAAQRGWTGGQWDALYKLIMGESGFRNTAQNPTSSAYGMFQFLNSTWATVGGRKTSDPALQTLYGLRYIASRYGTPANAYAKWSSRSPHWYDKGGWLMPGLSLAYNGTGRPERVLPPSRSGGATVHNHYHFPNYVGDKNDLVRALEDLRRQRRLPKAG